MIRFLSVLFLLSMPLSAEDSPFTAQPFDLHLPADSYIEEVPAIATSPDGQFVYVFNRGKRALLAFDVKGTFVREIGAGLFSVPHGLRVDADGNIWTADTGNHVVLKFAPSGKLLMVLGKKGTASAGWFDRDYNHLFFNKPSDIAFDAAGNIFVADGGNFRVLKFSPKGNVLAVFGEKGKGPGQFNFPHSLIVDAEGRLLVSDRENQRIQLFDLTGAYQNEWADVGYPYMLAHAEEGNIWMTDARADKLVKLSPKGEKLKAFGAAGKSVGQYGFLHGITVLGSDLLVSDILNWKVERLTLED